MHFLQLKLFGAYPQPGLSLPHVVDFNQVHETVLEFYYFHLPPE